MTPPKGAPSIGYGSNQYGSYPNLPGIVPSPSPISSSPYGFSYAGGGDIPGTHTPQNPTFDPALTNAYLGMLYGQMGQGVTPFNLSVYLPSSGMATQPGQLTAPLNPLYSGMEQFFSGGPTNIPGLSGLQQMSQTGDPTSALPAWQAMIAAQQQNIAENQADLREQFAFGGNLASSPFGGAMSDYMSQTALGQNAMLAQMQQQALESAAGRQLSAQQFLGGAAQQFGGALQGLDQNAIDATYQEFIRTQPQYNPMMQYLAQASLATPGYVPQNSASQTFANIMQGISSLI